MSDILTRFPPTRTAALERLQAFLPSAGKVYASRRNYDLGRDNHSGVSQLSPYIRARLMTEEEVLTAVLGRFAPSSAEKFIQEVYWRTYWKGWLEMRPSVWQSYQRELRDCLAALENDPERKAAYDTAVSGQTEIEALNAWARELVETGYMHNHARMWFASIWIFTLRLPWQLGADFFLRHLLDGDPASNTLGWRWVAGIQTRGKTYLARVSNIAKYTEERFRPLYQLATDAPPVDAPPPPARMPLPEADVPARGVSTGFLLHDDDMSPADLLRQIDAPLGTFLVNSRSALSPAGVSDAVRGFADGAAHDVATRYADRLGVLTHGSTAEEVTSWARGFDQIVAPYAPVGPNSDLIARLRASQDMPPIRQVRRTYDSAAWPFATAGFFKFKEKIPRLLKSVQPAGRAA